MNAVDDIRIRTESLTVTDDEAVAVIEWCREWLEDCGPGTFADLDGEYYPADTLSIPALLRGCDKHIEGGLSFVLSDVRRMANEAGTPLPSDADNPPVALLHVACREADAIIGKTAADAAIERAENRGMQDGRAAGSWFFDGNTEDITFQIVLKGIEDGDPAVMDSFPSSPLSGEWADDLTPAQLFEDLDMSGEEDYADDVLRAFEDAFSSAAHDEIERVARYQTAPEEDVNPSEDTGTDPDAWRDEPATEEDPLDRVREFDTRKLTTGQRVKVSGYRPSLHSPVDVPAFFATVVRVRPSGSVVVDCEDAQDGAGNPVRLNVSRGTVEPVESFELEPAKVVSIGDIVSVDGNLYRFEFRTSADPLGVGVRGGDRYILRLL